MEKVRPWLIVFLFFCLTLLFGYGNKLAKKGGVLDKAILNTEDPYYQMDKYVQSKRKEGFLASDFILSGKKFPDGIKSVEDLKRAWQFNQELDDEFPDAVISLNNFPNYQEKEKGISYQRYLDAKTCFGPNADFDLDQWKSEIKKDPAVYGKLISRNFDKVFAIRYLQPDYDEINVFRQIVQHFEKRQIPWWQWLFKTDIHPVLPNILMAGWVMGRSLIDAALNVDTIKYMALGFAIALPVFLFSLRSFQQTIIASLVVLLSLIWTRGSIGLIDWLIGWPIRERVYVLLAYSVSFIQGISFCLHKFKAYNQVQSWQKAREVNSLIGMTAIIGLFGFLTLWWFKVLTIRELGILAGLNVVWLYCLVVVLVPALDQVGQQIGVAGFSLRQVGRQNLFWVWADKFEAGLTKITLGCYWLITRWSPRRTAHLALWSTLGLVVLASYLILVPKYLIFYTKPLEFIRGTLVYQTAQELNQPNEIGFESLKILVEPRWQEADGILDPEFIRIAQEYQDDLGRIKGTYEVSSVLDSVRLISQRSYRKELADQPAELSEIFNLRIESSPIAVLTPYFYYHNGICLFASRRMDNSQELGQFCDRVMDLAKFYPALRISPFGKVAAYPRGDKYIREGKPKNLFSSQVWVIIFCGLFIAGMNWKLKTGVLTKVRSSESKKSGWRLSWPQGAWIMSMPFLFASAGMALIMMLFKIPLDVATAAITALAINASIDFAIYLAIDYQQRLAKLGSPKQALKQAMEVEGVILLEDMLLNSLCFLPLITSHFPPVRDLGWMMGIMLVFCALGVFLVMMPLLYAWGTKLEFTV